MPLRVRALRALAGSAFCLTLAAGTASAGPLVSASLGIHVGIGFPPVTFVATGASGTSLSNLHATIDAGSAFAGTISTTTIPTTAAPPIDGIIRSVASNDAGVFSGGSPGAVGGVALFRANVKVLGIELVLLNVPLQFGLPSTFTKSQSGIHVTAIAGAWTVGATTLTGVGRSMTPITAMATGSNALTPNGAGTLMLVSPVKILTNVTPTIFSFGTLTLNYVPEPTTALLLGLGAVWLGLLARPRP